MAGKSESIPHNQHVQRSGMLQPFRGFRDQHEQNGCGGWCQSKGSEVPRRIPDFPTAWVGWNGVICAGVILSVMGGVLFFNVLGATNPWPVC